MFLSFPRPYNVLSETAWFNSFCCGIKSKLLVINNKRSPSLSPVCLDFSAQVAEGWHSMYLGLFITEKVTVGVVASVCQGSNALKPLTVSLAQAVGSTHTVWQTQLGGGHLNPCQTSKRQAPMNNSTTKLFGGTAHMGCFITWPFLQTNTHLLWLSKVCEYCFNV